MRVAELLTVSVTGKVGALAEALDVIVTLSTYVPGAKVARTAGFTVTASVCGVTIPGVVI